MVLSRRRGGAKGVIEFEDGWFEGGRWKFGAGIVNLGYRVYFQFSRITFKSIVIRYFRVP